MAWVVVGLAGTLAGAVLVAWAVKRFVNSGPFVDVWDHDGGQS